MPEGSGFKLLNGHPLRGHSPGGVCRDLALFFRSAALFFILYQIRLFARDLAETSVFIATLAAAFIASGTLARRKLHPPAALLILALTPWAIRFFIALPRIFFTGPAVLPDSLLLDLDRNNFVSLFPFYWAAFTTYFSSRSRTFLRGDIIAADTLLLILFSMAPAANIAWYRWPVLKIALFTGVLFLQILSLVLSLPPEYRLQKKEGISAGLALLVLVLLGGILFIRPSQEGAVTRGGGLLEPKLFRFDFSQVLRLESEISMTDDLVFIVKKDPEDTHILLRRSVLSGYDGKQGFYRHELIDERAHPQRLPDRRTFTDAEARKTYRVTDQEYYLVNFDSSALIAMNEPVRVIPFESWDASSFSSAYEIQSHASEALPFELFDAVRGEPGPEILDMSPEEYAWYTEYGGDERFAAFAREITGGIGNYWEKVQTIYERLKYGEYRYSLKPGIAPDGDQLGYFLFQSKKGYCSYYAFAMTLLLRSLGIPARVAAGFFIDPQTNTFDYYPVRTDMAHAWVEVRFPGYGWIEYDPTSNILAENEEFRFSSGVPQDLFERLMKEILDNRSRLTPKEGSGEGGNTTNLAALGNRALRSLEKNWPVLLLLSLTIWFLLIRTRFLLAAALTRNPRKGSIRLWKHLLVRLRLGGFRRMSGVAEPEWVRGLEGAFPGIYELYQKNAAARFAPEYTREDHGNLKREYGIFRGIYRRSVPPGRRLLAWFLPPLALLSGPSKTVRGALVLFLFLPLLALLVSDSLNAQNQLEEANRLYREALDSQNAEFWERAIELFNRGNELYPQDVRFPWSLGDLYYSRRLYGLAWEEYRKAERLLPEDPGLLYYLSRTAGYLNEDAVSAAYLERLLAIEPDNRDAIGNLGWMYYKLHRLEDGERLLTGALRRFDGEMDFSMTLGTIYSDMFRYDEAKMSYMKAIAAGESLGDRQFTAVTHYNLSILESRFYQFDRAFDQTNASLAAQNRASGRLAQGELFLRRLEFGRAFDEFQEAYEMDTSPLSKVNLAQSYQIAGRLEEARLYAEDCLRGEDLSWMLNYGIDPVRYKRDLHEILAETYAGLERTEYLIPYGTIGENIRSLTRGIVYRFKAAVHRRLFRKYSLLAARAYGTHAAGTEHPDALIQYYNAFEAYPRRALAYLRRARDFEIPRIPEAEASYIFEEAGLLKDSSGLLRALENFDPLWERDMIAESYGKLAEQTRARRRTGDLRNAAERLYALNRGALRQRGIVLPVELSFEYPDSAASGAAGFSDREARRAARTLERMIRRAGFDPLPPDSADEPGRFRLRIGLEGGETGYAGICELYDGGRGITLFRRTIPLESLSSPSAAAFARALGEAAFGGE
jgi:transglutaminase-like putative cysteine protease/tetratricopeptide (TPR) repeat protein